LTIASQLITDAYRKSNLLALGTEPTVEQQAEALRYLNRLFKSTIGNEATNLPTSFPTDTLTLASEFPFPEEYDIMFIVMLAMELNPAYGQAVDEQTMFGFRRARTQFRAKYHTTTEVGSELALVRHAKLARDRDGFWYDIGDFNTGNPV